MKTALVWEAGVASAWEMNAAEATMETMENFMIYVVEVVDLDLLKGVWFEEPPVVALNL